MFQLVAQSRSGQIRVWNAETGCVPAVLNDLETWLLGMGRGQLAFRSVPVRPRPAPYADAGWEVPDGVDDVHYAPHAKPSSMKVLVSFSR